MISEIHFIFLLSVSDDVARVRNEQSDFVRWIDAFRANAHISAQTNPISDQPQPIVPAIDSKRYGLRDEDEKKFTGILNVSEPSGTVRDARQFLERIYCGETSIEYSYIESECEREWLVANYEKTISTFSLDQSAKYELLDLVMKSQIWDNFLATKFPTLKRYGGEGAESMMAFFWQVMRSSASEDLSDIVIGMPHRGRLNLLTTMMKTRPAKVFRKLKGLPEFPQDAKFMGDVVSHFG